MGLQDFSSLTSEQLEKLQQDMWGDIHDSDSRPLVSSVQSMDILMVGLPKSDTECVAHLLSSTNIPPIQTFYERCSG